MEARSNTLYKDVCLESGAINSAYRYETCCYSTKYRYKMQFVKQVWMHLNFEMNYVIDNCNDFHDWLKNGSMIGIEVNV